MLFFHPLGGNKLKATDISWSIDVEGGIVLRGQSNSGLINEIPADETYTIPHRVFGLGRITITVNVADDTKQATAFLFGSLVLRVQEI